MSRKICLFLRNFVVLIGWPVFLISNSFRDVMIRMDIAWLYVFALISCTVFCVAEFFEKLEEKK